MTYTQVTKTYTHTNTCEKKAHWGKPHQVIIFRKKKKRYIEKKSTKWLETISSNNFSLWGLLSPFFSLSIFLLLVCFVDIILAVKFFLLVAIHSWHLFCLADPFHSVDFLTFLFFPVLFTHAHTPTHLYLSLLLVSHNSYHHTFFFLPEKTMVRHTNTI